MIGVRLKTRVDEALRIRLKNIFENPVKKLLMFSGGKESLVLAHAIAEMIRSGEISPVNFEVFFVDEEAIFDCVERVVLHWRDVFVSLGVQFNWLCLQFRHFNCFNKLYNDESFITWDERASDVWVRAMPEFAITSHPRFRLGMSYQQFFMKLKDYIQIIGLRSDESVQRRRVFMKQDKSGYFDGRIYPIYDWSLNDVWLYLFKNKIKYPDAYFYMWKCGVPFNRLRISQFFSVDTAPILVEMIKYYPGLYEKILKREPNAKLVMFYYNTYMFRRTTSKRKKLEGDVDYKEKLRSLMQSQESKDVDKALYKQVESLVVNYWHVLDNTLYRDLYNVLLSGDPKRRTIRAIKFRVLKSFQQKHIPRNGSLWIC